MVGQRSVWHVAPANPITQLLLLLLLPGSYSEIKRKSEAHKRVMELAVAAAAAALAFLVLQWAVPAAGTLFLPK